MELSGAYTFNAPAVKVWAVLTDPDALSKCIPGCQSMEATGETNGDMQYKTSLAISLGPITGRYNAAISMSGMTPHRSFRLSIKANGPMGFADGHADITLEETEEETGVKTQVTVNADSQVGGAVARVGQRLMGTVAKTTMDGFFKCVQGQVE